MTIRLDDRVARGAGLIFCVGVVLALVVAAMTLSGQAITSIILLGMAGLYAVLGWGYLKRSRALLTVDQAGIEQSPPLGWRLSPAETASVRLTQASNSQPVLEVTPTPEARKRPEVSRAIRLSHVLRSVPNGSADTILVPLSPDAPLEQLEAITQA